MGTCTKIRKGRIVSMEAINVFIRPVHISNNTKASSNKGNSFKKAIMSGMRRRGVVVIVTKYKLSGAALHNGIIVLGM